MRVRKRRTLREIKKMLESEQGWRIRCSISGKKKRLYRKELGELKKQYNQAKRKLEDERETLKRNLDTNLWISEKDRNEALYRYEAKTKQLFEIEKKLDAIEKSLSGSG